MKWTRLSWSDELRRSLERSFDNRDGFDAAEFLKDNITSGRYDAYLIEGLATRVVLVCHTWGKSCYVLSLQGRGLLAMIQDFIAIMRNNGIELVVFDTERRGLLKIVGTTVDIEHIDGERYAFGVTNNED